MNELKFFYSNMFEVASTPMDFVLKFIRRGQPGIEPMNLENMAAIPSPVALDAISIAMSPQHAKSMLPVLVDIVLKHEARNGKIPMTPEDAAQWKHVFGTEP